MFVLFQVLAVRYMNTNPGFNESSRTPQDSIRPSGFIINYSSMTTALNVINNVLIPLPQFKKLQHYKKYMLCGEHQFF